MNGCRVERGERERKGIITMHGKKYWNAGLWERRNPSLERIVSGPPFRRLNLLPFFPFAFLRENEIKHYHFYTFRLPFRKTHLWVTLVLRGGLGWTFTSSQIFLFFGLGSRRRKWGGGGGHKSPNLPRKKKEKKSHFPLSSSDYQWTVSQVLVPFFSLAGFFYGGKQGKCGLCVPSFFSPS